VKDVVHACVLAMEKLSGVYNVGTGKETSLGDIAKKIVSLSGSKQKIVHASARDGDIIRSYGDVSKMASAGFSVISGVEKGLTDTIFWMRNKN
jgi:nucleoside-diphosphate-sugar epimerase